MKYSVVSGPHLDGRQQMRVRRVQGEVVGVRADSNDVLRIELNR